MALELEDETQTAPAARSTEDRCPVCLGDYQQKAFVDACFRILEHSNPQYNNYVSQCYNVMNASTHN